ncbi:MAG: hypothetical protein K5883_09805, partial [Pseudobutyrivibrio sp.]|nr:hypothetical protein [Pseudobutyrivibrio sp.]
EETTAPVDNKDKEVKDNKEDNTKKPSSDSSSSNTESNKSNSNNKSSNNSSSSAASASQVAKVSTVNIEAHADAPAESSNNSSNTRHAASNGVSKAVASSVQTALASDEDETTEVSEKAFEKTEIPVSLTSKTDTKAELSVGKGKAVINVEKGDSSDICARTTDDETLLKNILTEEQLKRVAEGATVNLKITANVVSEDELSADDSKNINDGVEKYKKDVPGLSVAGYVDLSIYLQLDDEDWSYVSDTNKPVELVINVPKSMQGLSENYYILRLHDGETTMFSDNDDDPETITISTGKFSIYVIMYDSEAAAEIEKTEKNEMSILIIFLLVLLVVLIVQIIYIFIIRKKLHKAEQV